MEHVLTPAAKLAVLSVNLLFAWACSLLPEYGLIMDTCITPVRYRASLP